MRISAMLVHPSRWPTGSRSQAVYSAPKQSAFSHRPMGVAHRPAADSLPVTCQPTGCRPHTRSGHPAPVLAAYDSTQASSGAGMTRPPEDIAEGLRQVFDHPFFVNHIYPGLVARGDLQLTPSALYQALSDTLQLVAPLDDHHYARHGRAQQYCLAMTSDFDLAMDTLALWRSDAGFTEDIQRRLHKREQNQRDKHAWKLTKRLRRSKKASAP